ncbi:MAG TPA: ABC transporter substrate binding protein [Vicinamibacteria bacterium]|nr:ABC transporter substrate binding protein [Vicinamibacteria bacterium]
MRRHARRVSSLALACFALGAAGAQPAEVAVVKSSEVAAWRPAIEALKRAAPGHTFTEYDLRNDRATADGVLAGVRGRNPIVVALGPLAAQLVRTELPQAPLVYAMVQDPVKLGLAPAPGVTGVAFAIPVKNQIAAFRMVNPRGVRIGVIYSEENTGPQVAEAEKAAPILRVAVVSRAVTSEREIPGAVRALLAGDSAVDALWMPADPVLLGDQTRRFLITEMVKAGRPVYASAPALVAEGALVSNGPDLVSVGEQIAELVNRLASGDRSRIDMAVPRAELVVNRRVAARLKIDLPAEALKAAKVF